MSNWYVPNTLWKGGDVWVIGGGPSIVNQFNIPKDVVQQVRDGASPSLYSKYMKEIHDKHVVGINVAYKIGEWIDFLFFGDSGFFIKYEKELYNWSGLKVTCNPSSAKYGWIRYLERDRKKLYGITDNPRKVSWNGNSGAAALSMIANAGASRIFLLGFDMNLDNDSNQHWHKLYGAKTNAVTKKISLPFERHLKGFPEIAKDATARGIKIINVNPESAITSFEKMDLQTALNI